MIFSDNLNWMRGKIRNGKIRRKFVDIIVLDVAMSRITMGNVTGVVDGQWMKYIFKHLNP
jgi:hypothetical protein